jgi:hypothetical protein
LYFNILCKAHSAFEDTGVGIITAPLPYAVTRCLCVSGHPEESESHAQGNARHRPQPHPAMVPQ